MNIYQTIIRPITTEKSENFARDGKYIFIVRKGATKVDIRNAAEKLYGVPVAQVNITKNPAKSRAAGRGRKIGKRPELKKAIVSFKGKKTIDINKFTKK